MENSKKYLRIVVVVEADDAREEIQESAQLVIYPDEIVSFEEVEGGRL